MDETIECKQYTCDLPLSVWNEAEPLIVDAAQYARFEFTSDGVFRDIAEGKQQLWTVIVNGAIKFVWVTEIQQQSGRRICLVFAAAGVMKYGLDFWPYMSTWMRGNDIDEAEVYCRPSMSRLLKKHGLKTRYEVLCINPAGEIT
jgi:hypothetical protein